MRVVFRVDASLQIGTGHVMRCLALAEVLRTQGGDCCFICRAHTGNLIEQIKRKKFVVHTLPIDEEKAVLEGRTEIGHMSDMLQHSSWLVATQDQDALSTAIILKEVEPDWLVVDHYALDDCWEKSLVHNCGRLMVIDDIADRHHECDLLLDQNLFDDMSVRYKGRVPEGCIQLLGPQYALLHSDYAEFRLHVKPRKVPLNNLLVFFGTDQYNLTELALSSLKKIKFPFESIDVVISKHSPCYENVKKQSVLSSKIHLHSDLPSLAPLMVKADLAIGAGGGACWERFCLGLPSLIVTLAENQRPVTQDLHRMSLVEWIGDVETIQIEQISTAFEKALSRDDIENWSERCMAVCSGQGATMVADTMMKISIAN